MRPAKLNILITGASSGMGEACARALAPLGHSLVLGARSGDKLKKLQKELSKKTQGKIVVKTVDVQSTASVKAFTSFALKSLGSLHVVLACAGLARGLEPIETITDDELEEMVRTNVEGLVKTLRATLPHLKKVAGVTLWPSDPPPVMPSTKAAEPTAPPSTASKPSCRPYA